jgi:hypothetical protein
MSLVTSTATGGVVRDEVRWEIGFERLQFTLGPMWVNEVRERLGDEWSVE